VPVETRTPIPTLDELAAKPERVSTLSPAALQDLLARCVGVQTILLGALIIAAARAGGEATREPDQLLDIAAAARRLGMSKDWLYRHADQLPFTVPMGSRRRRFSSHGIAGYIRARRGRPSV
jgi:predicted DNA-binding transcriptional regulator AlpA